MQRHSDLNQFYDLLDDLESKMGGKRKLADCNGRMEWPKRGVYFFFEPNELRAGSNAQRVVRVGTHGLVANSQTTLWKRLYQHKGQQSSNGGNHRGSIFRLLIGEALMNRDPSLQSETWGKGSTAPRQIRLAEQEMEAHVSEYLGNLELLYVSISDNPGPNSDRAIIERNAIALLSNFSEPTKDLPTANWLGNFSGRQKVLQSGLWNNNHVDEIYDPNFLSVFKEYVTRTSR